MGTHSPPSWARAIVRLRFVSLAIALIFSVVAALLSLNLKFDFSPDRIFLSDDDTVRFYLETQVPAFGAGDTIVFLGLQSAAPFGFKDALEAAHTRLEKTEGVAHVRSLVNVHLPTPDLQSRPALEVPQAALKDPTVSGLLVSKDGRLAALMAQLDNLWANQAQKDATVLEIRALTSALEREHPDLEFALAGIPVSQQVIVETLVKDQLTFVPLTVLVMAVLLFFIFRSIRGVLLPFLATGAATLWAVAWLSTSGHHINVVNNAIVTLLLVIAIADAIHIVCRYLDEAAREEGRDRAARDRVVARTVQHMVLPCLLTTTTTALGFASAIVAEVNLIQEFGLDAGIGVLMAFVATLLIVPAGLTLVPLPKAGTRTVIERATAHVLVRVTTLSLDHRGLLLLLAALLTAGSALLGSQVSSNQKLISELPDSDPTLLATRFFEERLCGILPFDVVLEGEDLLRPEVIKAAAEIAHVVNDDVFDARARSYGDVLGSLSSALGGESASDPVHTFSLERIAQLQVLLDTAPDEERAAASAPFLSADGKLMRVVGLAPDAGSEPFGAFVERLQVDLDKRALPPGVGARLSGGQVIAVRALDNIVRDMLMSIGLALVVIFVFIAILFRSLKMSFIALLPNALPLVATLAAMRVVGIELRVATVIIFCMSLGVAVDSCVHLLSRLRELKSFSRAAILEVARGSGRPIVYATSILLVGFSAMGLSDFNAIRHFALLAGSTLGSALVVDLVLLPAIVRTLFKDA